MHVDLKFTGDGILAFIGGALALIGVWLSNRQSVLNLQKQLEAQQANLKAQLDAEKKAREEERKRETRAIATSLLAEVSDFCEFHIKPFVNRPNTPRMVKVLDTRFAVYQGNVAKIGNLRAGTCQAVVHFYDIANEYLAALRRYREIAEGSPLFEDYHKGTTAWPCTRKREDHAIENRDKRASEFFNHKIRPVLLVELAKAATAAQEMLQQEI